jgi:hypothetical protein
VGDRVELTFTIHVEGAISKGDEATKNLSIEAQIVIIDESWGDISSLPSQSTFHTNSNGPHAYPHAALPTLIPRYVMLTGKARSVHDINIKVMDISLPLELYFLKEGRFEVLLCTRSLGGFQSRNTLEESKSEWLVSSPANVRVVANDMFE